MVYSNSETTDTECIQIDKVYQGEWSLWASDCKWGNETPIRQDHDLCSSDSGIDNSLFARYYGSKR